MGDRRGSENRGDVQNVDEVGMDNNKPHVVRPLTPDERVIFEKIKAVFVGALDGFAEDAEDWTVEGAVIDAYHKTGDLRRLLAIVTEQARQKREGLAKGCDK